MASTLPIQPETHSANIKSVALGLTEPSILFNLSQNIEAVVMPGTNEVDIYSLSGDNILTESIMSEFQIISSKLRTPTEIPESVYQVLSAGTRKNLETIREYGLGSGYDDILLVRP